MDRHAAHIPFVDSGSYPLRPGNAVRPLIDGEPAFRRICEAVESAARSVWVTVAFLEHDVQMPDGRGSFFDVLDAAVARGIDVRVIFWRSPEQEADVPNIHFPGSKAQREWLAQRGSRFLARWDRLPGNLCHHQKSWLVDAGEPGEVAFIGGINLEHASLSAPGHRPQACGSVHDVYLELRGPSASDAHHNFVQRWNEASERGRDDGVWPGPNAGPDLAFPTRQSPAAGEVPVQVARTVHPGQYQNGHPAPGAEAHAVHEGERSVLHQYEVAIDAARSSIYIEDQVIGSPRIILKLLEALERDVRVVFLVPGNAHREFVAARRNPDLQPYFELLTRLKSHAHFTLAAIASHDGPGRYHEIYVHAKIALVDDGWATIGSTNVADRSFEGDTELNATFWHEPTVRELRGRLLREHAGIDTSELDDRRALAQFAEVAQKNAARRARGERLEALAYQVDPDEYGL